MYYYLSLIGWIVLCGILLFTIFYISICRLERLWIHQFVPIDLPDFTQQSSYVRAMNSAAEELGFQYCGWFAQKQGGVYRATITAWLSPDQLTLVLVVGGKIAGISSKRTVLVSTIIDYPSLQTSDEPGIYDLSENIDQNFLLNADLAELYDFHKSRIVPFICEPFDKNEPLVGYETIIRQCVQSLVKQNLACFLNVDQNQWRYTTKGAILMFFRGFLKSMRDSLEQKERVRNKKRPGDNNKRKSII